MPQPTARKRLQRLLDGLPTKTRDALVQLMTGYPIRLSAHSVTVQRVGDHLEARTGAPTADEARLLDLINLMLEVGVDRVRQCPFTEPATGKACGKWFVATRGQRWCSLEHSRQGSYQAWWDRIGSKRRNGRKRKETR